MKKILTDRSENNGGNTIRWKTGRAFLARVVWKASQPKVTFEQRCERREIALTLSAYLIKS